mgnify:FL=1
MRAAHFNANIRPNSVAGMFQIASRVGPLMIRQFRLPSLSWKPAILDFFYSKDVAETRRETRHKARWEKMTPEQQAEAIARSVGYRQDRMNDIIPTGLSKHF